MFSAFGANEPHQLSNHWAAFLKNRRLRIIGALKPFNEERERERKRKYGESRRRKKKHTHILSGWFWRVWGTVLFVLSDPVMHFSLSVYEENHCRPLKTTYHRSDRERGRGISLAG